MAKPRGFSSGFSSGFGVGRYWYALSPYTWSTHQDDDGNTIGHWHQSSSAVGAIDLRPIGAQALAGGSPQGFAFVASMQPVGVSVARALHMSDENASTGMQDAWESELGYRPQGTKLVDLLWDQLTNGADPDGDAGPKPLMPNVNGVLELVVAGHSVVKSERFRFGRHAHTNRVQAVLQREFEALWEATNGDDFCCKALDWNCCKYGVDDWQELVPRRLRQHVPGRLPHATTVSDDFNRADESPATGWTQNTTNIAVASNRAVRMSSGSTAYYTTGVSGSDHYGQVTFIGGTQLTAAGCRHSTSADTMYLYGVGSVGTFRLDKRVSGSVTTLQSDATALSGGETLRCQASGSTISGELAGTPKFSQTDTAISGGVNAGCYVHASTSIVDDFVGSDLTAATVLDERRFPRGVLRGAKRGVAL